MFDDIRDDTLIPLLQESGKVPDIIGKADESGLSQV
jgi:hypothetical protein